MSRQRYESVDCAKGIGIMLVVFAHVIATHNVGWKIEEIITSFHMPLFFVLSGMFFSRKSSFADFIVGKINRLVVPFFFFYLTISILLPFIYFCYQGRALCKLPTLLLGFYNENLYIVGAIWFLLSLFFVSIIFWLITVIEKFRYSSAVLFPVLLGIIGYYIGVNYINLPCWFDTSLTCMPYFAVGYILKNKTLLLTTNIGDKYNIILFLLSIVIVSLVAGHTCYRANHFDISIWRVGVCGMLGFFAVFFVSNTGIKRNEIIQFVGKNSLIILGIHQLIMMAIAAGLKYTQIYGWLAAILNFVFTMVVCCLLIPIMLKYLPMVTGEKNLFEKHE